MGTVGNAVAVMRVLLAGCTLASADAAAPAAQIETRVDTLLAQMTLEEKIGQMTQVDTKALRDKSHIAKYALGSVLSGADSDPADNSPQTWLQLAQECQGWARKTRLRIPLLYGIDAVHGHNNIEGAVVFPHNIGLGATRNPALVEQAARATANEIAATGINWTFAPCLAVARDPRWGRTYESYSDSPELAGQLGAAAIRGYQGSRPGQPGSLLACAKHFAGDGGTTGGVDRGNTAGDEAGLRALHLAPYLPAIRDGVGSVMVSFSSWNGVKMHANKRLITDVLKGELGFHGLVISDWAGIDELPNGYKRAIGASVNAGLDMAMIPFGPGEPNNYLEFIANLKESVREGRVPAGRIDDAVRRILRVKFQFGLFEPGAANPASTGAIGCAAHRRIARECVSQSVVILKNSPGVLPLSIQLERLQVVGQAADDLGIQCGGWTMSWQGAAGQPIRGGTTILEAVRQAVSTNTIVSYSPDGAFAEPADVVLVVVGEAPYAEMKGDRRDLRLAPADCALIRKAKRSGVPVITVLFSGRPLIIDEALEACDAFVGAWLPGTEGQGVTDILFGDRQPTGKLPRVWPGDSQRAAGAGVSERRTAFPFGFGLTYAVGGDSGRIQHPAERQ